MRGIRQSKDGFMLVEIIAVLGVLTVLAGFLLPVIIGYMQECREKVCEINQSTLVRCVQLEKFESPGIRPERLLSERSFAGAGAVAAKCPSGGTYLVNEEGTAVVCSVHGKTDLCLGE